MPDVRQMAWRMARRKEDDVDPHVFAGQGQFMPQNFRSRRDPREPPCVDGEVKLGRAGPGLHLDEGEHPVLPRDQIDLAGSIAQAAADNLPSFKAQPPGGDSFGLPPALFGSLPLHLLSSIARA